jgi:hypothetical protein
LVPVVVAESDGRLPLVEKFGAEVPIIVATGLAAARLKTVVSAVVNADVMKRSAGPSGTVVIAPEEKNANGGVSTISLVVNVKFRNGPPPAAEKTVLPFIDPAAELDNRLGVDTVDRVAENPPVCAVDTDVRIAVELVVVKVIDVAAPVIVPDNVSVVDTCNSGDTTMMSPTRFGSTCNKRKDRVTPSPGVVTTVLRIWTCRR